MFFRFWCIYVTKIAVLFFVAASVAVAITPPPDDGSLTDTFTATVFGVELALGIAGAAIAIYAFVLRGKMQCPHCRDCRGHLATYNKRPALECERCGVVYVYNVLLNFDVTVVPWSNPDTVDDEE